MILYQYFCIDEQRRRGGVLEFRLQGHCIDTTLEPLMVQCIYLLLMLSSTLMLVSVITRGERQVIPHRSATAPMRWEQTPKPIPQSHDLWLRFYRRANCMPSSPQSPAAKCVM